MSGQYLGVLNANRQAKRDRAERRRLELQQSIRDFLTEAQNVEPWAEHRARTGNTAPRADTNKLWLAQKYLEITGGAALGTTSLAFAECLTGLVWGSEGRIWRSAHRPGTRAGITLTMLERRPTTNSGAPRPSGPYP